MNTAEKEKLIEVLNDTNAVRKFESLYYRWQDEKQYEDFNEYVNAMMESMPNGATLIKGTKRPFGVSFKYGGSQVQVFLKLVDKGKYCKLGAKILG